MYDESELLEDYNVLCWKTEDLALKSILNIELPLCSILTKLSSTNCLNLMVSIIVIFINIKEFRKYEGEEYIREIIIHKTFSETMCLYTRET